MKLMGMMLFVVYIQSHADESYVRIANADVEFVKASVSVRNKGNHDVLSQALQNTALTCVIYDRDVDIMRRDMAVTAVSQQTRRVTGIVTDAATGEPIVGANVVEKGTANGSITGIDGTFSLNVSENAVLQISYIGYIGIEINDLRGNEPLVIVMVEDSKALEEVVVVGYGTQSKRNVTGAISNINSDAIVRSNATMLSNALAGKIQGVSTRATDSRPGRATSLQIRNMGSPLFVIDGIPYGGSTSFSSAVGGNSTGTPVFGGQTSFNALSVEDIESISVLKDASAAVYGLRASNGVVLVTTKKGRKDESIQVNLNGYYGWQNFTRFPKPANAGQYVRGIVESEQN
ncbi:MAG: TonB-dependent receptor plug domain-containing protein, partial [Tannerella sp.]|nr:TonB-dependent receptor plug domain-containing protein [Tannerella sp.]